MRFLLLPLFLCGCELIVHFDPPPESGVQCDDGKDNDNDGNIDCDDDGCAAVVACMGPRCGDGNLDPPNPRLAAPTEVAVAAQAVAAGDLDGDGRSDLLVVAGGSVTILRNTASTFQAGASITVGGTLVALAIGDLDQDGDLDAVVVDQAGNQVVPLYNARGTLTASAPVAVGLSPRGIVLSDFDGDRDLDAATADGVDFDGGTVLENMGGTLSRRSTLDDAGPVAAIGTANLDGDFAPDLVTAVPGNDQVRAYRNSEGFFVFNSSAAAGTMPTSLAVLDINGDRRSDVVTGSTNAGSLSLLITDAEGNLGAGMSLAVPGATSVTGLAAGDFDRDGIDDLVVATGSRLVLFIANGSTGFTVGAEAPVTSNAGAPITFFADGDVRLDVAAPLLAGAVAVANGDGEECDDGNRLPGDACLPDCTLPATPLFARQIGGAQADLATDVAVDDADNVYVVGSFQGDLNIGGSPPLTSQGGNDFFVASFTPDGTLRWRRAFGGQMEDTALGVAVFPGGGTLIVVGQAGPSSYDTAGSIGVDQQAFALTMSSFDGFPFFVQTLTDRTSTGRASSVAFGRDGRALIGGQFDGTLVLGSVPITGPGGFVSDLQGFFRPLTGNPMNEVVRLRADGPNVAALLVFGGRVPELGLNSEGGRDLALVAIQPDNELGRVDQLGGGGDVIPGDLAACRPHALWLVTSFSGDFGGGLTAQGGSDIATVRADLDGNLTEAAVAGPGAETAFSAICDARQNLLIGGSLTLFDRTNAIGSFALDGSPIWGLPSVLAPLRMARDSRGFVYVVGGISAALSWGSSNFTPFGSNDGVLAKFRP